MRFDLHLRKGIKQRLNSLAEQMLEWEATPRVDALETKRIVEGIQPFDHSTSMDRLVACGVDGTGDYPSIAYGDSFIYVTVAQAACYEDNRLSGLKETEPTNEPVVDFAWVPEEEARRIEAFDSAFSSLSGTSIKEVIDASDYREMKRRESRRTNTVQTLYKGLIRPHAADAGNISVQLRSTGELGAALRIIRGSIRPDILMLDGTLSLPFVSRAESSLFHEHLKRLCCVEARSKGISLLALSKSHGLPSAEMVEDLARQKLGLTERQVAEHWYLRIPVKEREGWELSLTEGRRIPPSGALTYIFRLHKSTPLMRLDVDAEFWSQQIRGGNDQETINNERRLFERIDYVSHEQRCFGYPYPIKAAHDRASLTWAEREVFRKQIIDAAVRAGMKRSLFRSAAKVTGHE